MSEQKPEEQLPKKKKKKSNWSTWLLLALMLIGLAIMAYPTVSDKWNSFHSSRAILTYDRSVTEACEAQLQTMLEEARAYNASLLEKSNVYRMTDADLEQYESLLNISGNGLMGYIRIPSINVNIPIYHGTDEAILQVAVGHLDWSSLPVGGESTHAVLSGHRGLPSARLFTDLDKLTEGDRFTITVLNQTILYEIDQILIVEPQDVAELNIIPGGDYCTLVTCTPYGVNTHRILVRGHRIEDEDVYSLEISPEAAVLPRYLTIPAVGIPLLFLVLTLVLFDASSRRKRRQVPTVEELQAQLEHEKQRGNANDDNR